jgi:hypothetical protein
VGFHVRGVDHLGLRGSPVSGKFPEQVFPDAAPRPASKPVIDRRRRTIFGWTIAPAATAFQHMHNAADDAPIVHSLDTSHIRWQMGLDALPLLIAQPKQVPPHDPDPPKRIRSVWNQDCFAAALKLMSSHPRHEGVEVIRPHRVWLNSVDLSRCKICLAAAPTRNVTTRASWLIVHDPVPDGCLGLTQISTREMISFLRQIIVGWIDLRSEDGLCH